MTDESEIIRDLETLSTLISKYEDQVLLEDTEGFKYAIYAGRLIGLKTNDPGLILKIERS